MSMNQHNLRATTIGTGEFYFAEGATAASGVNAKGWQDFGNVVVATLQPETQRKSHMGAYRGVRRVDKTFVTSADLKYKIKLDEVRAATLLFALYGEEIAGGLTQSAITSQTGDTLPFTATPAVIGRWYDIKKSGARVREISAVTLGSLVAGTDYVLDAKNGMVRFLTAQNTDVAVTALSAAAISASSAAFMKAISVLTKPKKTGLARLFVFDTDDRNILLLEHTDFGCEIAIEGQPNFDGENPTEIELLVQLTDPVGNFYSRD